MTGLFPTNGDGIEEDEEEDIEEQLDNIIELLQSSSETHSDDEECWKKLKMELLYRKQSHDNEEWKRNVSEYQKCHDFSSKIIAYSIARRKGAYQKNSRREI